MGILKNGRDLIIYDIGVDTHIDPDGKLPSMPGVSDGTVIIIGGKAPVWQYGKAVSAFLKSAADVVAVFDPRMDGAVIVHSRDNRYPFRIGEVIPYQW
jgi:CRISPR-associated Csx3 family protein